MKTGIIGLGVMGKGIAKNLAKGGVDLTAFDLSDAAYAELCALGAKTAKTVTELADCEYVFVSLPNTKVVEAVLCGQNGLADILKSGAAIIDLSTISYEATIRINKSLSAKGIRFLDAPVSGMKSRAEDGTLTIMCGGDEALFNAVEPLLAHFCTKTLYMGKTGNGQLTKLINQLLFDINAAAIAEILPMAAKMGLSPDKVSQVVNSGTGRSYASEFFIPLTLKGDFSEGYPMAEAYKDLISAAELGTANGIPMPVLGAATATYQMALLMGYGELGKGAMIKVFESLLGVQFRSSGTEVEK